jgi:FAD/FMN-containing dehydrogenase
MRTTSNLARIVMRDDPGYDAARRAWQLAVDQRPAAVAFPADAGEVAATVRAAREAGLHVAPQGTGHNAGPLGALDRTMLLRTERLGGVWIDPQRRVARVGAGILWDELLAAADEHGLTGLSGSSPDVGVVGYSLGGGIGWLARRHGLQCNRITAVELVTADGECVRADAHNDPELLWALRGGGGSFGIVTALEFELLAVPSAYAGALVWDWRHAGPVLLRWSEWAQAAPDLVTTSARIIQFPVAPEVPEPLRGRRVVMIDGAYAGPADEAAPVLEPLRRLRPEIDTFAEIAPPGLARVHGDPEEPTPVASESRLVADLPRDAIEAFVETAGRGSGSPLMIAELRQLGGALARRPDRPSALPVLDGAFLLFAAGLVEGDDDAVLTHARRVGGALAPWTNGRAYLNFSEHPIDTRRAFDADTFRRLQAVKARLDPYGVIHANHPIA